MQASVLSINQYNPQQSFSNFADGMVKIATLDFDIEKSWEALLNADLSDASYFVSSMALAYLSGPKGTGVIAATETAQFQELLAEYLPKLTRPTKLTWPELLQLFRKAKDFENAITNRLKSLYSASNGNTVFMQVYLKVDGVVSVADNLIYNSNTNKWILNESKYGLSNTLSKNQKIIQDAIKAGKRIEIRTARSLTSTIGQGSFIEISEILRSHSINGSIIFDTIQSIWKK